jgi:3-oxoadipate enol-lactonase
VRLSASAVYVIGLAGRVARSSMELRYDEIGKGPAVILVHGLGGTSNLWGGIVPTLMREYRVVCPDLRGSGRTGCEGELSILTLVDDLVELSDRLSIKSANWVGHSYGSTVLQSLAVRYPTCVMSLTLIGPVQTATEAMQVSLTERAARAQTEGLEAIASATAQAGLSAETRACRPEIAAFVREMVMRQDPRLYALTCECIVKTVSAEIETLRCPTLVMTGDEDSTSPPRVAKKIANRVTASQFHILPRCGHWAPVERVRQVTDLLVNFLVRSSVHETATVYER